jgi:hypothetical protein
MTWKSIKKKSDKQHVLLNFVLSLKEEYNMTVPESQKCLRFITTAMNMKQIKSEDIIMKDGEITHIENFYVNEDGGFELELRKEKKASRIGSSDAKNFCFLGSKWRDYVESK